MRSSAAGGMGVEAGRMGTDAGRMVSGVDLLVFDCTECDEIFGGDIT